MFTASILWASFSAALISVVQVVCTCGTGYFARKWNAINWPTNVQEEDPVLKDKNTRTNYKATSSSSTTTSDYIFWKALAGLAVRVLNPCFVMATFVEYVGVEEFRKVWIVCVFCLVLVFYWYLIGLLGGQLVARFVAIERLVDDSGGTAGRTGPPRRSSSWTTSRTCCIGGNTTTTLTGAAPADERKNRGPPPQLDESAERGHRSGKSADVVIAGDPPRRDDPGVGMEEVEEEQDLQLEQKLESASTTLTSNCNSITAMAGNGKNDNASSNETAREHPPACASALQLAGACIKEEGSCVNVVGAPPPPLLEEIVIGPPEKFSPRNVELKNNDDPQQRQIIPPAAPGTAQASASRDMTTIVTTTTCSDVGERQKIKSRSDFSTFAATCVAFPNPFGLPYPLLLALSRQVDWVEGEGRTTAIGMLSNSMVITCIWTLGLTTLSRISERKQVSPKENTHTSCSRFATDASSSQEGGHLPTAAEVESCTLKTPHFPHEGVGDEHDPASKVLKSSAASSSSSTLSTHKEHLDLLAGLHRISRAVARIFRRIFQHPCLNAFTITQLVAIIVAVITPLREAYLDSFIFHFNKLIGGSLIPIQLLILGATLVGDRSYNSSTTTSNYPVVVVRDRKSSSNINRPPDEDEQGYELSEELQQENELPATSSSGSFEVTKLGAITIVLLRLIVANAATIPLLLFLKKLVSSVEGFNSATRDQDRNLILYFAVLAAAPTATNLSMVCISRNVMAESMAMVFTMMQFLAPLTMMISVTVAVAVLEE
ncbi:unnamed protein product [Amoebophrya sp. A120]|nr:unnamed protein product [Amoebophrya sp. A120]|eukprot:GSA120T00010572001.1